MKKNSYLGKFTPYLSQKNFFISLGGKPILPRKKGAGFIVIEGLDGSGQSTQAELLKNYLIKKEYPVVLTKEPTLNSKAGKKIRKILDKKDYYPPSALQTQPSHPKKEFHKKLQELFALDRREHLRKTIIPALKKGKIVVSDRYFFSSFAYGAAEGLSLNRLIKLNKDFLMPDLIFLLKVRPEICLKRIKKRGEEITLFEAKQKLAKVWQTYKILPHIISKKFIRGLPKRFKNVKLVDGEKSIKEVFCQIKDLLHKLYIN